MVCLDINLTILTCLNCLHTYISAMIDKRLIPKPSQDMLSKTDAFSFPKGVK